MSALELFSAIRPVYDGAAIDRIFGKHCLHQNGKDIDVNKALKGLKRMVNARHIPLLDLFESFWSAKGCSLSMTKADWSAVCQLFCYPEPDLSDFEFSGHSWPPLVYDFVSFARERMQSKRSPPPLWKLCARLMSAHKLAYLRDPRLQSLPVSLSKRVSLYFMEGGGWSIPDVVFQSKVVRRRRPRVAERGRQIPQDGDDNADSGLANFPYNPLDFTTWLERVFHFNHHYFRIQQRPNHSLGIGAVVWDCAIMMNLLLEDWGVKKLKGKRVIELGAGTGFVGLVAASFGAHVLITDLNTQGRDISLIELIQLNVDLNDRVTKAGSVAVRELPWGTDHGLDPGFDVIFASDVLYYAECFSALLTCILSLLKPTTEIIIAFKKRYKWQEAHFIMLAEQFFEIQWLDYPKNLEPFPDVQSSKSHLFCVEMISLRFRVDLNIDECIAKASKISLDDIPKRYS